MYRQIQNNTFPKPKLSNISKAVEKLQWEICFVFFFPRCRLMQQSVESVWNMAFDFILDNVQVVLQQTYGSTLKVI